MPYPTSTDASPDLRVDQAATTDVADGQVETGGRGGGAGGNGVGGNGSTGGSTASGGAGAGGAGAVSLAISVDRAVANGWSLIPVSVRTNGVSVPTDAELTFSLSRLDAGTLRPRVVSAGGRQGLQFFRHLLPYLFRKASPFNFQDDRHEGGPDPLALEERLASLVSDLIAPRIIPDLEIVPWRPNARGRDRGASKPESTALREARGAGERRVRASWLHQPSG